LITGSEAMNRHVKLGRFILGLAAAALIGFAGCGKSDSPAKGGESGGTMKPLNDLILDLRQNDGFLSKEEVDSIKNLASASKSARLAKWKDAEGRINTDSLAGHICKTLEGNGIAQDRRAVTDPVSEHFNINFFVKNTANMNGYIKPKSQFQDALFGLLADLKSGFRKGDITLNYVNVKVTHSVKDDNNDAANSFIYKIDRNQFMEFGRKNGGNTGTTDFDVIFGQVLETVNKNSVAVLAADFIFSPGKGVNVTEYLEKQRNSIRVKFSQKIDELNLAVLALKMESEFDGNYWNCKSDNAGRVVAKRPYYIWFIGLPQHLTQIAKNERMFVTLSSNGFTGERLIFESGAGAKQPEVRIVASENYSFDNKNHSIKAKRAQKGTNYIFTMEANFNDAFRDSVFYADTANYAVRDYELSVNARPPRNFRHRLSLRAEKITQGTVNISVMGKIPGWVNKVNSIDDTGIRTDVSEQGKTFGFLHIVGGVYSAFYPTVAMDERHTLQTFNLNIQLEK